MLLKMTIKFSVAVFSLSLISEVGLSMKTDPSIEKELLKIESSKEGLVMI